MVYNSQFEENRSDSDKARKLREWGRKINKCRNNMLQLMITNDKLWRPSDTIKSLSSEILFDLSAINYEICDLLESLDEEIDGNND